MDAVKFVEERRRMFAVTGENPKYSLFNMSTRAEDVVKEVEEWSIKNPLKTRQSVFIQQNPRVFIYDGVISIKPCQMVQGYTSRYCTCDSSQCLQCRKEYWMKEVESDDYS